MAWQYWVGGLGWLICGIIAAIWERRSEKGGDEWAPRTGWDYVLAVLAGPLSLIGTTLTLYNFKKK